MLVSLFITCYNDTLFPESGKAVVAVLERLGHRVEFREAQTCCGQMHYNTGYHREAIALIRNFAELYRDSEIVCIPSSSCVAMIREQYPKIAAGLGDPALQHDIEQLVPRVFEFSELLVDKFGLTDVGAFFPHSVVLHPSCHSLRSLHVNGKPARLLNRVRGLTLVDMPESDQCCGFGGTFAIKNADVSVAMLSDKLRNLLATGAEYCTALDNSCLMHIQGGLSRQGAATRCVYLAEILARTAEGAA